MRLSMLLLLACSTLVAGEYADIQAFEDALVKADTVQFEVKIEATGGVNATQTGTFVLGRPNNLRIDCAGTFMGVETKPKVVSDGTTMTSPKGEEPTPTDLGDAVLVGFVRQGLLHNLAMMSMGGAPDGTDGLNRKRFALVPRPAATTTQDGREMTELAFKIIVEGQEVGEASLFLDKATQVPVLRKQVVHFPQGDMHVAEHYSNFRINAKIAD